MNKLSIVSCGLMSPSQMTLESLAALRACGAVYSNSVDPVSARAILALGIPLLGGQERSYPRLFKDVLAAFKRHSRVGLLIYGNPFFLNSQLADLLNAASRLAEVEVLPGISSFDALVNMFGMSALSGKGLFIADLNFFMEKPEFEPGPDIFFFAPFRLNAGENAKFKARFIKALARKYPGDYPVYLVKCNPDLARAEMLKGRVSSLPALLKRCDNQHTLVLFSEERLKTLKAPPAWLSFKEQDLRRGA